LVVLALSTAGEATLVERGGTLRIETDRLVAIRNTHVKIAVLDTNVGTGHEDFGV